MANQLSTRRQILPLRCIFHFRKIVLGLLVNNLPAYKFSGSHTEYQTDKPMLLITDNYVYGCEMV
jgi:hypothetical protein